MENGAISDGQISASSQFGNYHAAHQARLHLKISGPRQGAWVAGQSDVNQWLQIDVGNNKTIVTHVATQGRSGHCCQWVTIYKLQYGNDGENFTYYKEPGQNTVKVSKLNHIYLLQ